MLAVRIEAQERAQQQQRRARRPGLRAARGRVLDGIVGRGARVAAEGLGQAVVEEVGGLEDRAAMRAASAR